MAHNSCKVGLYIYKSSYRHIIWKRSCGNKALFTNTSRTYSVHKKDGPKLANDSNTPATGTAKDDMVWPLALNYMDYPEEHISVTPEDSSLEEVKERLEDIRFDIEQLKKMKEKLLKDIPDLPNSEELDHKKMLFGPPDPLHPASDVPCGGCGALLHCNNTAIPGYVPAEKFKEVRPSDLGKLLCQRCLLLSFGNKLIDVEVGKQTYKSIVKRIKKDRAVVVMVVDVTDISNSVINDYLNQIGINRPIIIVGNKVDLLPKDDRGHLNRFKQRLENECLRANLNPIDNNIKHVCLISAKTGYGVEELINTLMKNWGVQGQVYLVGTTNAGKSTLFNTFLSSDYCKSTCRDIVQRATVSRWPGTTLNLIKFPIGHLNQYHKYLRVQRLQEDRMKDEEKRNKNNDRLRKYGKSNNAVLFATVGKTDFRSEEELQEEETKYAISGQDFTNYSLTKDGEIDTAINKSERALWQQQETILEKMYPDSKWVFDTPGLVNENQIINKLTAVELRRILKREMIRPRVFVMKPGDIMFVTGLARIDYLQGAVNTTFTVHTNHLLPVHVVPAAEADDFYNEHVGTPVLGLPLGDTERLNKLPSLGGREFHITTYEPLIASSDLQLSSLGWVSFAGKDKHIHIRAYTPGGRGMHLRSPALLPNILTFKGVRMGGGSKGYAIKRLKPALGHS